MRERVAYFYIDGKQFGDEKHALDVEFDITFLSNPLISVASRFSIKNLSKEDIYAITNNTALFDNTPRRKIQFFCGYKGNVRKIYEGEILKAQPIGQPDTAVDIEAMGGIYTSGENLKIFYPRIKYIDLLRDAIEKNGLIPDISKDVETSELLQRDITNFSHTGTATDYLRRIIGDITGFAVLENQLVMSPANGVMYVFWSGKPNYTKKIISINSKCGLIGIPEPNSVGVDIRVLLDVSLMPGQTIHLESQIVPLYNGLYNIQNIVHHGELRSNDFYTDLQCQRIKE